MESNFEHASFFCFFALALVMARLHDRKYSFSIFCVDLTDPAVSAFRVCLVSSQGYARSIS